ncbi:hypothetical protein DMC30DRAFT_404567 [Rhodotorula diobovata]|uniref:Uncharacterized protein n=1 Tax=Rhodotorula diobovata TaxID=5288 RepID=A0A5C5FM71_9BASI|nr:hypothetical protein DMC30DRAFT_404567 [Rhodotorula diobovata]
MVRSSDILLILVAIIFPPAAAAIVGGICSADFWINLLLTLLGYIPGHVHAFYLIYSKMQADERFGPGNWEYLGNAEYAPIEAQYAPAPQQQPYGAHPPAHGHYGAVHSQGQTTYGTA